MRSSVAIGVTLLAIWVLSWGSVSWANVASGVAVVVGLFVAFPDARGSGRRLVVRPLPAVRLGAQYVRDIVVANAQLAREVLRPRPRLSTAVVRVPLAGCGREELTMVAHLVAMTPGEMTVAIEDDPPVMYVHVLWFTSAEQVRADIWALRDQVLAAFGTDDAISAARSAATSGAEDEP